MDERCQMGEARDHIVVPRVVMVLALIALLGCVAVVVCAAPAVLEDLDRGRRHSVAAATIGAATAEAELGPLETAAAMIGSGQ